MRHVFFKVDERGMVVDGIYVSDLIITGTKRSEVDQVFIDVTTLELKDLGVLSKFLVMQFLQCDDSSVRIDEEQTIVDT